MHIRPKPTQLRPEPTQLVGNTSAKPEHRTSRAVSDVQLGIGWGDARTEQRFDIAMAKPEYENVMAIEEHLAPAFTVKPTIAEAPTG